MKKVVITGGTGMIGLELIHQLVEQNVEILLLIRENSSKLNLVPDSNLIQKASCNLNELKSFCCISTDYDIFFHLGWDSTIGDSRNNTDIQCNNIQYTLDAVELAAKLGCKVFVGAGSQAEYGIQNVKLTKDVPCQPVSGYGIAKHCAGLLAKIKANQLGLRFCWVRILSIYGVNDNPKTLISYVIHSLQKGVSPEVTKCEQLWDYLYVGDCANALISIAMYGKNGKIYPIGSGHARPLKEYLEEIKRIVNSQIEINYGARSYPENQPMYLCADISELETDTGFIVKTSFEQGIKNIIDKQ